MSDFCAQRLEEGNANSTLSDFLSEVSQMCIRDRAMEGCPVTVRLLDPPLHEFVPHDLKGQQEMADTMGVSLSLIHI